MALAQKQHILFVDDEVNILNALRRGLRPLVDAWNMTFVTGADEALAVLAGEPVDVVVSDVRMPGKDGVALMREIQSDYPGVARILMSGYTDQELVLGSSALVHQFLPKPFDFKVLRESIEGVADQARFSESPGIKHLLSQITVLPSLPNLYFQLMEEASKIDSSVGEVAHVISQDVAMSSKILQIANSAFFSRGQTIGNPERAVMFLGLEIIKTMALSIHVFSMFDLKDAHLPSIEQLWKHSMVTAGVAHQIARFEKWDREVAERALIAGLLHDIGRLVLVTNFPARYAAMAEREGDEPFSQEAEYREFGASHVEVGAYVVGLWGFPRDVVHAIQQHHKPGPWKGEESRLCVAIHSANAIARAMWDQKPIDETGIDRDYLREAGYEERLTQWLQVCQEDMGQTEAEEGDAS